MTRDRKRQMLVRNFKDPGPRPNDKKPEQTLFCDVQFRMFDGKYALNFRKLCLIPLTSKDTEEEFKGILKEFADDRSWERWRDLREGVSIKSDLSLYSEELSFVVFNLTGGKDKNWAFARVESPITVQAELPQGTGEIAFEARRVDDDGEICRPDAEKSGCEIAYFVVDGANLPPSQTSDGYELNFNLHIEILGKNSTYIPVIIDPDVRHPGGNKP